MLFYEWTLVRPIIRHSSQQCHTYDQRSLYDGRRLELYHVRSEEVDSTLTRFANIMGELGKLSPFKSSIPEIFLS
jgi:hypothetical protein